MSVVAGESEGMRSSPLTREDFDESTSRPQTFFSPRMQAHLGRVGSAKLLYATTGGAWTFPQRVTYSIEPDGTNIGGYSSDLQANLNAQDPGWQTAFQNAAAIWQSVAGINLVQVADNGESVGAKGNQQGDPNVGDIRIGGFNMSTTLGENGVLGEAFYPPPLNTGTVAGDLQINDGQNWNHTNGYDLETVAIHEFGHALGLDHSKVAGAVMQAYYNGTNQKLSADDTSGIQSLYGAWPAIANTGYTTATNITGKFNSNNQIALAGLEIPFEKNAYFNVVVPANTTGFDHRPNADHRSQLALARLLRAQDPGLDQNPTLLLGSGTSNTYGTTLSTTITNVTAGETIAIRIGSSNFTGTNGSAGGYALLVNLGTQGQSLVAPPNTTQAAGSGGGSGDSADSVGQANTGGGLLGGLLGGVVSIVGDVLDLVHIGNLSGYGDFLTVSPQSAAKPSIQDATPTQAGEQQTSTLQEAVGLIGGGLQTQAIGSSLSFTIGSGSNATDTTIAAAPMVAQVLPDDHGWDTRPFNSFGKKHNAHNG